MYLRVVATVVTIIALSHFGSSVAWGQLSESDLEGAVTILTSESQGSGFYLSDSELLTAAHVVGNSREIRILNRNGLPEERGVVSLVNRECDVALVELTESERSSLDLSEVSTVVGESVFAIGSPIGRPVLSVGKVEQISNLFITTSVPVDSGSSGGPLITADRKVVGVVVQKNALGNAIAVPIERATKCLQESKSAEKITITPSFQYSGNVAISGLAIVVSLISLFVSLMTLIKLREKRKPIVITLPTDQANER